MTTDNQIRRVLQASLPDVDRQDGWDRVQARLAPAQRRRRLNQAVAAATAVAVLVVLVVTARSLLADTPRVVIDGTDTTVTSTTTTAAQCPDPRVDSSNADYLNRWTTTNLSLRTDRCVLAGIQAPEPDTIPAGLGREMPLHPARLADDTVVPRGGVLLPVVEYYPIVHIGQVGDTETHGFLYWVHVNAVPTPNIGGAIGGSGEPMAAQEGIWSVQTGYPTIVYTVVDDVAAIVAIDVDGQPYAWQRPVARASVFVIDETQLPGSSTAITVTVFDRTGSVIDRYEESLD